MKGSGSWLVAEHPHDLLAGDLDQVAAAKGLDQRRCLVDQRAQVGRLDLPTLGQLAYQELGVGVDEKAVSRWGLACLPDAAYQISQRGDEGPVLPRCWSRRGRIPGGPSACARFWTAGSNYQIQGCPQTHWPPLHRPWKERSRTRNTQRTSAKDGMGQPAEI